MNRWGHVVLVGSVGPAGRPSGSRGWGQLRGGCFLGLWVRPECPAAQKQRTLPCPASTLHTEEPAPGTVSDTYTESC